MHTDTIGTRFHVIFTVKFRRKNVRYFGNKIGLLNVTFLE